MSWSTVKLADLATVSSGGGAPQDADAFSAEGVPFVRAGSLVKLLDGQPEESLELLQPDVAADHRLKLFPAGTVLFAKSGMSATKGHVYQLKKPAYVVNHLAALIPRSEVSGRYLRQVLKFKSPTCLIKDEAYPSIRLGDIESMEVPAPKSESERERIAAILDQADELRRKRQRALDRLNQLGQAIFVEMFGDPAINPMGWPEIPLGEMAEKFSDGPFGSNLKSEHYVEQGVRVIRLQNIGVGEFVDKDRAYISEEHFRSIAKHACTPGDVLVGTMGDPNLRACLLPDHLALALNKADCVQIRPKDAVASRFFICGLLNHPSTERMAHDLILGQTRARISMGRLRSLRVPCPPLALQEAFGLRISKLEELRAEYEESLASSERLFTSLQHRAFRGELTASSLKEAAA